MPQEERQTRQSSGVREKVRTPRMYSVFAVNDDFTTFEFVVWVLAEVFGKSVEEGYAIAERTHYDGRGLVGKYTRDMAHSRMERATALARANGFPLRFTAEPEDNENR